MIRSARIVVTPCVFLPQSGQSFTSECFEWYIWHTTSELNVMFVDVSKRLRPLACLDTIWRVRLRSTSSSCQTVGESSVWQRTLRHQAQSCRCIQITLYGLERQNISPSAKISRSKSSSSCRFSAAAQVGLSSHHSAFKQSHCLNQLVQYSKDHKRCS